MTTPLHIHEHTARECSVCIVLHDSDDSHDNNGKTIIIFKQWWSNGNNYYKYSDVW